MNNRIEFSSVKLIPIASVLKHYGIEGRRQGEYLVAACPLPTHSSKEKDTFKVSVRENWWTCFSESCKQAIGKRGGDVIDFVCLMDGIDLKHPLPAAKKLAEIFCVGMSKNLQNGNASAKTLSRSPIVNELTTEANSIVNKPMKFTLQGINPEHPMVQSRGISIETARDWGIGHYRSKQGTASMDERIVFPIYEDGALIGYAGRTILPVTPENPKWRLGKGLRRTFLYGIERCDPKSPLVVCESPWEAILGHQMGKQTVSLIGCSMTAEQEKRVEPYGTLWIMMDDDKAGHEASELICARLRKSHRIIRSFLKD